MRSGVSRIGEVLLHWEQLSSENAVALRENLIQAYLKAGLVIPEETDRIWLVIMPPDLVPAMEGVPDEEFDSDPYAGGYCELLIMSPELEVSFGGGMTAVGPGGKIVQTEPEPDVEPEVPRDQFEEIPFVTHKPASFIPFSAVFQIGCVWALEEVHDRFLGLAESLARYDFFRDEDLERLAYLYIPVPGSDTSMLILFFEGEIPPLASIETPDSPQPKQPKPEDGAPDTFDPRTFKDQPEGGGGHG